MKAVFVLLLTLLSLGFIIDTPESRRETELQHKAWREKITQRFDFPSLRGFLAAQVKKMKQVEGVTLSKSKISAKWSLSDGVARCGDWLLAGGENADFTLQWIYADVPESDGSGGTWKIVNFHCRRTAKDRFLLISTSKSEEEYVVLTP